MIKLETLIENELEGLYNQQENFLHYIRAYIHNNGIQSPKIGAQDILQNVYEAMLKKFYREENPMPPANDGKHARARFYMFLTTELKRLFNKKWRSDIEYVCENDKRIDSQNVQECRELVEHFRAKLSPAQTVYLERVLIEQKPLAEQFEKDSAGRKTLTLDD